MGLPGGSGVKNPPLGDVGLIPESGRSGEITGYLPGEFHGQRSLAGYSPWSHKELDMTERISFSL